MQELSFGYDEMIVSKTDLRGKITYCNEVFLRLSGYTEKELLGAPHNILRHPDMPKVIFKHLWETIQKGNEVNAYVVNKTKCGDYYWVFANVTPSFDVNGRLIAYYSVRRKPSKDALNVVKPLYAKLLSAQKNGGIEHSESVLHQLLKENGVSYEEYILSI
jgi:PAS domain S-box-containing protein